LSYKCSYLEHCGLKRKTVHPEGENATADEVRIAMNAAPNERSYIRLASIRALFMGMERELVCQMFVCSDRMVRLWIECFNRAGIDALEPKPRSGRPRKVKLERVRDILVPILEAPSRANAVKEFRM
jgi:transposase